MVSVDVTASEILSGWLFSALEERRRAPILESLSLEVALTSLLSVGGRKRDQGTEIKTLSDSTDSDAAKSMTSAHSWLHDKGGSVPVSRYLHNSASSASRQHAQCQTIKLRKSSSRILATYLVLLCRRDCRASLHSRGWPRSVQRGGNKRSRFGKNLYAMAFTYVEEVANGACLNQKGPDIRPC